MTICDSRFNLKFKHVFVFNHFTPIIEEKGQWKTSLINDKYIEKKFLDSIFFKNIQRFY